MLPIAPVNNTFMSHPRSHSRRGEFPEGGQKQLVHLRAQVGQGRGAGIAGGAEDAFERVGGGGGADGKAQAGNAIRAELFKGLVGVGFRVTTFVAIVVRETVREDDQQPIWCAGLVLENFARTTDAGAEARIARWLELVEAGPPDGAETLSEGFDRRQMDSVSAVRPKRIDRDTVAKLFERGGQRGRRPSLVVVYGEAIRIGIGGRSGGIEQNEHPEIAGKFAAFQINVFGW